jgi:hypothetical protein
MKIYNSNKLIGTTFADEISAAGLSDVLKSWGHDGSYELPEDTPQETVDAIAAVFEAHYTSPEDYAAQMPNLPPMDII